MSVFECLRQLVHFCHRILHRIDTSDISTWVVLPGPDHQDNQSRLVVLLNVMIASPRRQSDHDPLSSCAQQSKRKKRKVSLENLFPVFRESFVGMRRERKWGCREPSPHKENSQTLDGPFAAVLQPIFARKYVFESSRRDLQDTHYSTNLRTHFFSRKNQRIFLNVWDVLEILHILFKKSIFFQICTFERGTDWKRVPGKKPAPNPGRKSGRASLPVP